MCNSSPVGHFLILQQVHGKAQDESRRRRSKYKTWSERQEKQRQGKKKQAIAKRGYEKNDLQKHMSGGYHPAEGAWSNQ